MSAASSVRRDLPPWRENHCVCLEWRREKSGRCELRTRICATDHRHPFSCSSGLRKREPAGLPFSNVPSNSLSSGLPSRSAHNFASVKATSAYLDLGDLVIDYDTRDLKVRLPGPARLVVRVRDVVAIGNALIADVAAVSLDLCHLTLRPDQLDARHLGAIALAVAGLENARVPALARREARSYLLEQLVGSSPVR